MHTPEMKFATMEFKDGENVTVRAGHKWSDWVEPGMGLFLTSLDGAERRYADVVAVNFISFDSIPATDIADEHEAACRTYDGLLADMRNIYPDFSPQDYVTVVRFRVSETAASPSK